MILEKLIEQYILEYPETGFPMELLYEFGETETIEILKLRNGRKIEWIDAEDDTRDGGNYIYI